MTKKKVEYWSGKPTDPEHLNYTQISYEEVFKREPVFEKGYPSYEAVNKEHKERLEKKICGTES